MLIAGATRVEPIQAQERQTQEHQSPQHAAEEPFAEVSVDGKTFRMPMPDGEHGIPTLDVAALVGQAAEHSSPEQRRQLEILQAAFSAMQNADDLQITSELSYAGRLADRKLEIPAPLGWRTTQFSDNENALGYDLLDGSAYFILRIESVGRGPADIDDFIAQVKAQVGPDIGNSTCQLVGLGAARRLQFRTPRSACNIDYIFGQKPDTKPFDEIMYFAELPAAAPFPPEVLMVRIIAGRDTERCEKAARELLGQMKRVSTSRR